MNAQPSVLKALRASLDDLADEVERLPAEAALWRAAEAEWSQHECLTHLQIVERHIFLPRMRAIVEHDNPFLPVVDERALLQREWDPNRPRAELVDAFAEDRRAELALLEAGDWERMGRHEKRGPLSLGWMAHYTLAHTWEHLSQMMRVRLNYLVHG
jgi:hypothetical protein